MNANTQAVFGEIGFALTFNAKIEPPKKNAPKGLIVEMRI